MQIPSLYELVEPCIETVRGSTAGSSDPGWAAYRAGLQNPALPANYGNWAMLNVAPNVTGPAGFSLVFNPAGVISAPAALDGCYLRCHGFSLEKAERASHVSNIYSGGKMHMVGDYEVRFIINFDIITFVIGSVRHPNFHSRRNAGRKPVVGALH
jgi:hypothetical protein